MPGPLFQFRLHFGERTQRIKLESKHAAAMGHLQYPRAFPDTKKQLRPVGGGAVCGHREHFPRAMYRPWGVSIRTLPFSTARLPRSHTCRMPPAVTKPS